MAEFRYLFEPVKVGPVELKNRILCLAMGAAIKIHDGEISQPVIDFYAARVGGGASAVFAPLVAMYPGGDFNQMMPGAYEDKFLPGMRKMARAIQAQGAKAGAQIFMLDDQYSRGRGYPKEVVGPSAIAKPRQPVPRALSLEDIEYIIEKYAESTARAREAGFDIVEYHFGIGFLVAKFISKLTNQRTDDYGGDLKKRMRLPLDIIAAAKKKAGDDFPISVRFAADELLEGGHGIEEGKEVAKIFATSGIHMLDVQPGWTESPVPMVQMSVPRTRWIHLAEGVKQVVDNIPVVAATRINDPVLAEEILASGKADIIGMARPLLADPELPNKAKEGRLEDIRMCTACCYCMDRPHNDMRNVLENLPVMCAVNAQVGREAIYTIDRTPDPKKVVIVGGGPAGMEAARVAALRGHRVTLYEKENKLGGMLNIATLPPHKEELFNLINFLTRQIEKNGVETRVGEQFTAATLDRDKPDIVILATGSTPLVPGIDGVENPNVVGFTDVLTGARDTGDRVLVIGGGIVGCETAEFLRLQGKQVTILEMLPKIGVELGVTNKFATMLRFREMGMGIRTNAKVVRITESGVEVLCNGSTEFLEADTVVLATGMKSDNSLAEALKGKAPELIQIGDCLEPHQIAEAVESGFRAAILI